MKKIIMFLVLAVSIISLGLTIYYFSVDNEVISISNSYLVVDKNDTISTDGLLTFKHKNEHTQYSFSSSDESVLSFVNGKYVAKTAGRSTIVISTSNRAYSRLTIEVKVCDGSSEYPYQISSVDKLRQIGNDDAYPLDANYVLGSDIYLTHIIDAESGDLGASWTPIENFSGTFDGAFHTIYDMSINDATLGEGTNAGFIGSLQSVATSQDGGDTQTMSYATTSQPVKVTTGVVKNVLFKNVLIDVSNAYNVGAVVGGNFGEVHTSTAEGVIKASGNATYVGGIVGNNSDLITRPVIDRCGYTGGMYITAGTDAVIGGVVGNNNGGTVSESYYITGGESNSLSNADNVFGGIVGSNNGTASKANIYDNFFFMTSVAVDSTGDEPVTLTDFSTMSGVVYSDVNSSTSNNVYGNYFGGVDSLSSVSPVTSGSVNSRFNTYLTTEEFSSQDISATKFVNVITESDGTRTWAFGTVWSLGAVHPILNIHSASGSVYVDSPDDILADTEITTASEFIDAVTGNGYFTSKNFNITVSELDLGGVQIGSAEHPMADYLLGVSGDDSGALISGNGTVVKNFTLVNNELGANVGLARNIAKNVTVSGISFENVSITGQDGAFVGVLAGKSEGANIYMVSVKDVTCTLNGTTFGGIFGLANHVDSHALSQVSALNVNCEDARFVYAGGIVGYNRANIIGTKDNPCSANTIKLSANYSGGIVGNNISGTINNVIVTSLTFNQAYEGNTSEGGLYSGEDNISGNSDVLIGGIAGRNYGSISGAYANSYIKAYAYNSTLSAHPYSIYVGGIVGTNNGQVDTSYVFATNIQVIGGATVVTGGLVGTNYGTIATSYVDSETSITCDMTVSVAPTEDNSIVFDGVTIAGGLVGYDDITEKTYSIYRCVSQAKKVQAFYSAGLVALEFGKMMQCSCGDDTVSGGKMAINGFMSGGICVFVRFGFVKDCYAFNTLKTCATTEEYDGINSILGRRVSGTAGIALIVDSGAVVRGCYALTTFDIANGGESFGAFGANGNCTITGCVYVTEGSQTSKAGVKLTNSELSGTDDYAKFIASIGSEDNSIWAYDNTYPVISAIDMRNPSRDIPSYNV